MFCCSSRDGVVDCYIVGHFNIFSRRPESRYPEYQIFQRFRTGKIPHLWNTYITLKTLSMQYSFAGAIAACFLFSMGNKPKASFWKYMTTTIFFAILSAYMIVCAIVCAVWVARTGDKSLYDKMIVSVLSTVGLWAAASILAMDPAHLITSLLPYLLLSPLYIVILNA
jgi:ABC-type Fe3+ transport system permease subunit